MGSGHRKRGGKNAGNDEVIFVLVSMYILGNIVCIHGYFVFSSEIIAVGRVSSSLQVFIPTPSLRSSTLAPSKYFANKSRTIFPESLDRTTRLYPESFRYLGARKLFGKVAATLTT